jgi:copper chaperone CopZ
MQRFFKGVWLGVICTVVLGLSLVAILVIWRHQVAQKEMNSVPNPSLQGITSEIQIKVDGMYNQSSTEQVVDQVKKMPGIISVSAKRSNHLIVTQFDPQRISPLEIQQGINKLGYKSSIPGATGGLKVIDYSIKYNGH